MSGPKIFSKISMVFELARGAQVSIIQINVFNNISNVELKKPFIRFTNYGSSIKIVGKYFLTCRIGHSEVFNKDVIFEFILIDTETINSHSIVTAGWSLVVLRKTCGKICFCLDPNQTNKKVIEREFCQISLSEETLSDMSGSTVLRVLEWII